MKTDKTILFDVDCETPVSIIGEKVRADWYYAGEGWNGDYNPCDPEDERLLRFDIYMYEGGDWEPVDDASYCTCVKLETEKPKLVDLLTYIWREFNDVLYDDPDASVKKLGEALSWVSA